MNKEQMKWIFSVVTVIIFVGSMFFGYISIFGGGENTNVVSGQEVTGFAEFDAAVSNYEPYILLNDTLNESEIADIGSNAAVDDVLSDKGGFVVLIKDRENVTYVYSYLRSLGFSGQGMAILLMPDRIRIINEQAPVEVKSSGNSLKYPLEPVFKVGDKLTIRMVATGSDGTLTGYQSPQLITKNLDLEGEATVEKIVEKSAVYEVPWEIRGDVDAGKYRGAFYKKNNGVVFTRDLNASEMIEKKSLSYVTFINERSATINGSFSNSAKLVSDFRMGAGEISFPASKLSITIFENETSPQLPYPAKFSYKYIVSVAGLKTFGQAIMVTDRELKEGEKIRVKVGGVSIGDRAQVTSVKPA